MEDPHNNFVDARKGSLRTHEMNIHWVGNMLVVVVIVERCLELEKLKVVKYSYNEKMSELYM